MKKRIPIYLLNSVHYKPTNQDIAWAGLRWLIMCISAVLMGVGGWVLLNQIWGNWR